MDIDLMNTLFLTKWLVRFYDASLKGQWKNIIQTKYKNYIITSRFSPFWKSILKNKDLIDLGFNKTVGSGSTVFFFA
jgi:hypothetical protein